MDAITLAACRRRAGRNDRAAADSRVPGEARQSRKKVLIPDSAHGTNPATAVIAGYEVENIKSESHGQIDVEKLRNW